jgi:ribonuclease HII
VLRTASTDFEKDGWARGSEHVVGVDEVGCGPLAGPVVAAAVCLYPGQAIEGAYDSKLLTRARREELATIIRSAVSGYAISAASTREIERLNVRRAAGLAMRRAIARLPFDPDLLLVDGNPMPELGEHTHIHKGDRRSLSIACASILAKVVRDRLMELLDRRYPQYGWARNKGYATGHHLAAIREHGPSPHHRGTFSPVVQPELDLYVPAEETLS